MSMKVPAAAMKSDPSPVNFSRMKPSPPRRPTFQPAHWMSKLTPFSAAMKASFSANHAFVPSSGISRISPGRFPANATIPEPPSGVKYWKAIDSPASARLPTSFAPDTNFETALLLVRLLGLRRREPGLDGDVPRLPQELAGLAVDRLPRIDLTDDHLVGGALDLVLDHAEPPSSTRSIDRIAPPPRWARPLTRAFNQFRDFADTPREPQDRRETEDR